MITQFFIYLCKRKLFMMTGKKLLETVINVKNSTFLHTVKRPKFGNGPLVRHPLSDFLKNHFSAWAEVSDLVQRGERLYIFFCTNKKN